MTSMKNDKIVTGMNKIELDEEAQKRMLEVILAKNKSMREEKDMKNMMKMVLVLACVVVIALGIKAMTNKPQGNRVQEWNASFEADEYFKYSGTSDTTVASKSVYDAQKAYEESRYFSGQREMLETEGAVPRIDDHPLFYAMVNYKADGTLYSVELSWSRRDLEGLENYSDLTVLAGYEEVPMITDCIEVQVDEHGNVMEPMVTVTRRDGVDIIARGSENQNKSIVFQNDSGWYQVTGSWNDRYEDVVALMEWFFDHPIDFTRFPIDQGDQYTYTTLEDMPNAFENDLPDFAAVGLESYDSTLTLKNGEPSALEIHFMINEKEVIHWCLETEPDYYDLMDHMGDIASLTKEQVMSLKPVDNVTTQTRIKFMQGDKVITVFASDMGIAWDLIASIPR